MWIDVENASGTRYGDGPIRTATSWTSTRRLDRAGEFSFTMPASDPRLVCSDGTNLLQHKRVVRCWAADEHGIREKGAGVIDTIEWTVDAGGATMITVSGSDLLRELANRTVGDLELFEATAYATNHPSEPMTLRLIETYNDPAFNTSTALTPGSLITLGASEPLSFLFIQHTRAFSKITLTLSTVNNVHSDTFQVQYYNASDPLKPAWEALPGLVNNTERIVPATDTDPEFKFPFGVTGTNTIEFSAPTGWTSDSGKYSIRMFDYGNQLGAFNITAISVTIVEPVTDGLQRIMALAPEGWTLDPAGMYATWDISEDVAKAVYMQFAGESVLGALVLLAEQTGEHFTLSAAARRVWWIGEAQESSGIRAVQSTDATLGGAFAPDAASQAIMLITSLSQASDSYELYTRSYAYGAGVGSGRLTMEKTTRSTAGYTLGTLGAYLESDAATAIYGRIDKREDYPDIAPVDTSAAQIVNAANTLYDRVLASLKRKCQLQYAYSLEVVPSKHEAWPGQTIHVDYHEWVENFHAVNINQTLWVLETTQTIDDSGAQTVALTVATIDYWSTNDYRAVAKLMGKVETDRSVSLPATGYTSIQAGVPVNIGVKNGQVVAVGRVKPAPDGWYSVDDLRQLKIESGVITGTVGPSIIIGGP
jgi:hypothetical protein